MRRSCAAVVMLATVAASSAAAQDVRLRFNSRPRLIECLDRPCFRVDVLAVDAQERPVELPDAASFEVFKGDEKLPYVYVTKLRATRSSERGGTGSAQIPRAALVLFDTSGSMNDKLPGGETKFAVARRQLDLLFEGFREQIDRVKIAPFDSQQVAARVRGGQFEMTREGIRRQIASLSASRKGNTALYSAIDEALQVLEPYAKRGAQTQLIVLTDGQNDVRPPSDPGLLNGREGLERVRKAAAQAGIPITTIGYGASGVSLDEAALRSLAYPSDATYFRAADEESVKKAFGTISARSATGYRLLAGPLSERRDQLMNATIVLRVKSGDLTAESPPFVGPPVTPPAYEGDMTPQERRAVFTWRAPETGLPPVAIRMIVLLAYSALIALMWFGLPRLIWPERYIPKPAVAPARPRAAAGPGGRPGAPARPPGRPGAVRPGAPQRPEVTIPAARPQPARPGAPAAAAGRQAPPPRPRPAQPPAPRSQESATSDTEDATRIFIPPAKKPGRDS